jgi:hypothetical protein
VQVASLPRSLSSNTSVVSAPVDCLSVFVDGVVLVAFAIDAGCAVPVKGAASALLCG